MDKIIEKTATNTQMLIDSLRRSKCIWYSPNSRQSLCGLHFEIHDQRAKNPEHQARPSDILFHNWTRFGTNPQYQEPSAIAKDDLGYWSGVQTMVAELKFNITELILYRVHFNALLEYNMKTKPLDNPSFVLGGVHVSDEMRKILIAGKKPDTINGDTAAPVKITRDLWELVNPQPPIMEKRDRFFNELKTYSKNVWWSNLFMGMEKGYVNNCPTDIYDENGNVSTDVIDLRPYIYPKAGILCEFCFLEFFVFSFFVFF